MGFVHCHIHGAQSALAVHKAREMLALLRAPAIELAYTLLEQCEQNECPECHYPRGTVEEKRFASSLIRMIWDRTELGPRATLEIKQTDGDLDLRALLEEEKQELAAVLTQLREIKARVRRRLHMAAFDIRPGGHDETLRAVRAIDVGTAPRPDEAV
jgi:hypothetical protein